MIIKIERGSTVSKWIGTSNSGFSHYAIEELRRIFPTAKFTMLSPGEVYYFETEMPAEDVLSQVVEGETIFLRHIQPIDRELKLAESLDENIANIIDTLSYIEQSFVDKAISVHVRQSKQTDLAFSKVELRQAVAEWLDSINSRMVLKQPELIIAIYMHKDDIWIGFGTPQQMRSDWPGGAIRFQREDGQISRAKFKLLEAEIVFDFDLAQFSNAIDVGSAPGGWTSLLLERGLKVTAIDPAKMDERLLGHPNLTHIQKNASDVKLPKKSVDLIVCDMSWSPIQMSKLILDLQYALKPNAYGIITVKLMHKKGMNSIKEVKQRLASAFHIIDARQLFHNREEITLFIKKI